MKRILLLSICLSVTLLLLVTMAGSGEDYEFLVRVEDKIRDNVTCVNPAHEEHDFTDDTHGAVCPNCNSKQYLYRDNDIVTKKGDIITFKLAGGGWGTNERKHYAIIRIDNITYAEAQKWCESGAIRARKYELDLDSMFTQPQRDDWIDQDKDPGVIVAPLDIKENINVKAAM